MLLKTGRSIGWDIGEETITDLNMVRMQTNHPDDVKVVKFTRREEGARTGADWEWWIGVPKSQKWLCLQVQAKKLDLPSLRYAKINYPRNSASQLRLLISDSRAIGAVPVYCF